MMLSPKEHLDQEIRKSDEYFKEILACVRPYILSLTSVEKAQLCKVWIDKLSTASTQARLRNEYLLELCRQLKVGCIGGIFSRPPPNGFLLPLPKSHQTASVSSSLSDHSNCNAMGPQRNYLKQSTKCSQPSHQRSKTPFRHRSNGIASTSQCTHTIKMIPTVHFDDEIVTGKTHMQIYERRIDTMNTVIANLKGKNEYLRNQLLRYQENVNNNTNQNLNANISSLTAEISKLKAKLTEVQIVKDSLEVSHKEMAAQYNEIFANQLAELRHELHEAQSKNEELKSSVTTMTEKLEEIIHGKDEDIKMLEKQWIDNIKRICQRHDLVTREKCKELLEREDFELLEKSVNRKEEIQMLTNKIEEMESKLDIQIKDEGKLQVMLVEQYTKMKEEITKMRNEIDLASKKQNAELNSQISELNKAIVKIEKSKERLGSNYEKKISHIVKNKDLEITTLQLKLQAQKNELCTSLNTEKQSEIDNAVCLLEERYKALLAEEKAHAQNENREHLRQIALLQDKLFKRRIS